jgi:hypothetical protein
MPMEYHPDPGAIKVYQRWKRLTPNGVLDPERAIRAM